MHTKVSNLQMQILGLLEGNDQITLNQVMCKSKITIQWAITSWAFYILRGRTRVVIG